MLLALVLVASAGLVAPHLFHPLWQDEVKTLELFSRGGFWHPFQVYPFPNNHVLSSALLSVWGDLAGGAEAGVAWLRGLPAAMFLAAAGLLAERHLGATDARQLCRDRFWSLACLCGIRL